MVVGQQGVVHSLNWTNISSLLRTETSNLFIEFLNQPSKAERRCYFDTFIFILIKLHQQTWEQNA